MLLCWRLQSISNSAAEYSYVQNEPLTPCCQPLAVASSNPKNFLESLHNMLRNNLFWLLICKFKWMLPILREAQCPLCISNYTVLSSIWNLFAWVSFRKTHKCKLILNGTRKTTWLLMKTSKICGRKCQNIFLKAFFHIQV